jgi:hypothetical protein
MIFTTPVLSSLADTILGLRNRWKKSKKAHRRFEGLVDRSHAPCQEPRCCDWFLLCQDGGVNHGRGIASNRSHFVRAVEVSRDPMNDATAEYNSSGKHLLCH